MSNRRTAADVNWEIVDWTMSTGDIAREVSLPKVAVSRMRRLLAPETLGKTRGPAAARAVRTEAFREQARIKSTGRTHTRSARKKVADHMRGLGEKHHTAVSFSVRDPDGRIFRATNVRLFVRQNPNLFKDDDVIWPQHRKKSCRAVYGLLDIINGRCNQWKGWTAVWGNENR